MNIYFEVENKEEVKIMCNGKQIGQIFTPSGSGHDAMNAIQVCGFDRAFDLWGCGVFSGKDNEKKQDIQLMFSEDSRVDCDLNDTIGFDKRCSRCYNVNKIAKDNLGMDLKGFTKCTCEKLSVVKRKDLIIEKMELKKKNE